MIETLLAIDQGTTGSTALLMDSEGRTVASANVEFPQHYPRPGWVEHDPEDIWQSVLAAIDRVLPKSGAQVRGIGLTNQRETAVVWDRASGRPIHRAIVWQCRRTAPICESLSQAGHAEKIRKVTGLVIDPYFSGTKIAWILDNVEGARARAERGELAFGTIDSYLAHRLTGGAHITDVSNASRTLLMNLDTLAWHDEMCDVLRVPKAMLPVIVGSAENVGTTKGVAGLPDGIPICGIAGDQHAALFGQGCLRVGDVKCTYGTGAFVLMNTGDQAVRSRFGLLSTVGWKLGSSTTYAMEGSAFIAGAAVQWLRDGLGVIGKAADIEPMAAKVEDSGGVVFVPALAGLGAPYWDPQARGMVTGITRGTTVEHLARATLDGIAHQVSDLVETMREESGKPMRRIRVDGGAAANGLLMQLQANYAGVVVERPRELETTARGAAMLAGVGLGWFKPDDIMTMAELERTFEVEASDERRAHARAAWKDAVHRARSK